MSGDDQDRSVGSKAVVSAVRLLHLTAQSRSWSVRDLAANLGIGRATAQRVVNALVDSRLLVQDDGDGYSLGPGVMRLATAFQPQNNLIDVAIPYMHALRDRFGETVTLSIAAGTIRLSLYELESQHQLRFTAGVGVPHPLHVGAASKALLAFLDEDDLARVLGSIDFTELTPRSPRDPHRLRTELATVKENGYAVSHGERVTGGTAVAVPIWCAGAVVAALSICGPRQRMADTLLAELVAPLVEAAGHIGRDAELILGSVRPLALTWPSAQGAIS